MSSKTRDKNTANIKIVKSSKKQGELEIKAVVGMAHSMGEHMQLKNHKEYDYQPSAAVALYPDHDIMELTDEKVSTLAKFYLNLIMHDFDKNSVFLRNSLRDIIKGMNPRSSISLNSKNHPIRGGKEALKYLLEEHPYRGGPFLEADKSIKGMTKYKPTPAGLDLFDAFTAMKAVPLENELEFFDLINSFKSRYPSDSNSTLNGLHNQRLFLNNIMGKSVLLGIAGGVTSRNVDLNAGECRPRIVVFNPDKTLIRNHPNGGNLTSSDLNEKFKHVSPIFKKQVNDMLKSKTYKVKPVLYDFITDHVVFVGGMTGASVHSSYYVKEIYDFLELSNHKIEDVDFRVGNTPINGSFDTDNVLPLFIVERGSNNLLGCLVNNRHVIRNPKVFLNKKNPNISDIEIDYSFNYEREISYLKQLRKRIFLT